MLIALIILLALVALCAAWYRQHLAHLKRKAREQAAWQARVTTFIERQQPLLPPVA